MGIRHPVPSDGKVNKSDYHLAHVFDGDPTKMLMGDGSEVDPATLDLGGGTTGPTGSSSGYAGLFSTMTGAAIGDGITRIKLSGYNAAGIGGADYIYDSMVTSSTVAANPRTQFLAADGRGFKLDSAQRLTLEMFGGKADWNGSTGTDNYAAFMAACQFHNDSNRPFVPTIHLGVGAYYSSQTIEPRAVYHVKGVGSGRYANIAAGTAAYATRIVTPVNTTCWRVCRSNTSGEGLVGWSNNAASSVLEGICFEHASQGTDRTAHGVRMRSTADLIRCGFEHISGDAIHIRATAGAGGSLEGDCNNWTVQYCNVHTSGGNGLYIYGADANAGYSIGFWTNHGVEGCGILDNSFLGNAHYSPQLTGYGNKGVSYGGRRYALITSDTALGGSTTPGTNPTVWYDIGAHSEPWDRFPAWVAATTYYPMMPYFGATTFSTLYNPYVETSTIPCHSAGMVIGGISFCTTTTPTLVAGSNGVSTERALGQYRSTGGDVNNPLYPAIGEEESLFFGIQGAATNDLFQRARLMRYRVKGWEWEWKWEGEDLVFKRFNGSYLFSWGGPDTTRTYGRATTQPNIFTLNDYAIVDPGNSNNARVHGMRDAPPATGYHAWGEFMWNAYPTAGGTLGWTCVAAGTPGTWKAVGAIAA